MNDKIKGLVEQAILDVDIVYEDNILNEELAKMYIPHCFAEMFAELIIQECMEQCFSEDDEQRIAKHFGFDIKEEE